MNNKSIAAFCAFSLLLAAPVAAERFQEGEHYQRIDSPASVDEDYVEVIEAFAYLCPACRNFLPHIVGWESEKPDHVHFRRLPVALQPGWELYARAYYTAQVMDANEEVHEALFHALHDDGERFSTIEELADFYSGHGLDREDFVNQSDSFAVDSRMRQNRNDVRRFGVRSTPTMIVQGKWLVSPNGFDSFREMLEAIDYLVEREAAELGLGDGTQDDDESKATE